MFARLNVHMQMSAWFSCTTRLSFLETTEGGTAYFGLIVAFRNARSYRASLPVESNTAAPPALYMVSMLFLNHCGSAQITSLRVGFSLLLLLFPSPHMPESDLEAGRVVLLQGCDQGLLMFLNMPVHIHA